IIPREIGNLINLISLYIANNALIGTIPTIIERLEKLQGLSLEGNMLEGSIPFELCHLKSLGYLYLTSNKLSGRILECLGDLFANSIPSTFTRLIDILQLNLSSNFLSRALSIDIGKWKVGTSIDFSKNQLSSEIPSGIGDLEDLTYLSLSGNRLYGSMLELFGGLIGLEFLDLSRNNFSGIIPNSLQKLLHLKYSNQIGEEFHTKSFIKPQMVKLLGARSFASIYQGTFLDGLNIAIKVFNLEVKGSFKSFDIECDVLCNIRHRNLVKIISSCYNVDFKALELEFMPNGSFE
ncbi:Serine-threonine/tyrosine-protein kinase, partial [Theobroma cacao]